MVVLGGLGVLQGIVTSGNILGVSYVTNPSNPSQIIEPSTEQRLRAIAGTVIVTGASVLLLFWGTQIYNKKDA